MFCGFNYYKTLRIYCDVFLTPGSKLREITRCMFPAKMPMWVYSESLQVHCGKGKSTLSQYRPQVKQHSRLHSISVGASDALWDIYGAQYQPTASSSLWANVGLGQCPHTNPKQAPLLDNLLFFVFYRTSENKYSKTSQYSFSFNIYIKYYYYILYNIQYYSTNKVN